MKKLLLAFLIGLIPGFTKGWDPYRRASMDLARLKMSLLYIKSVETSRLLFVSLLGIGACLIFLISGLILFHTTVFLYTPWSAGVKMSIGFVSAAIYLTIAAGMFSYIFSQAKWLKIFHAENIVNNLAKNSSEDKSAEKRQAHNGNGHKNREDPIESRR